MQLAYYEYFKCLNESGLRLNPKRKRYGNDFRLADDKQISFRNKVEKMEFREIDKSNYRDCMMLNVDDSQRTFVADNKQSLVEAAYEDGLYTLGIYDDETMVGFILYDYDDTYPGWSLSRFMIGKQFQGKGYGKQAVLDFLSYFKNKHHADRLYISVSLENTIARNMYASIGFREIKEIEYTFMDMQFKEMQMVKKL